MNVRCLRVRLTETPRNLSDRNTPTVVEMRVANIAIPLNVTVGGFSRGNRVPRRDVDADAAQGTLDRGYR